jgi:hypothetical protein
MWLRIGTVKVEKYKGRQLYWCPYEYEHNRNPALQKQVTASSINHYIMNALICSHEKV